MFNWFRPIKVVKRYRISVDEIRKILKKESLIIRIPHATANDIDLLRTLFEEVKQPTPMLLVAGDVELDVFELDEGTK